MNCHAVTARNTRTFVQTVFQLDDEQNLVLQLVNNVLFYVHSSLPRNSDMERSPKRPLLSVFSGGVNPLKPSYSNYYTLPCMPNLQCLMSDIRALWRPGLGARVPECQKLKMMG